VESLGTRSPAREDETLAETYLMVRVGALTCAIPVGSVIEIARPPHVTPFADGPAYVRGAAILRGAATPVLDLCLLITGVSGASVQRIVLVRAEGRTVALAVDEVSGLSRRARGFAATLPPLLSGVAASTVRALAAADAGLTAVLDASRILPTGVADAAAGAA
jgi:purine-binding chemotaxis protein CheW